MKWELETGGTLGEGMEDTPVIYPRGAEDRWATPDGIGANPAAGDGDDDEEPSHAGGNNQSGEPYGGRRDEDE